MLFSDASWSCKEINDADPSLPTGTYKIEIDGKILAVWCEMKSASSGWTVSLFIKYLVSLLRYLQYVNIYINIQVYVINKKLGKLTNFMSNKLIKGFCCF